MRGRQPANSSEPPLQQISAVRTQASTRPSPAREMGRGRKRRRECNSSGNCETPPSSDSEGKRSQHAHGQRAHSGILQVQCSIRPPAEYYASTDNNFSLQTNLTFPLPPSPEEKTPSPSSSPERDNAERGKSKRSRTAYSTAQLRSLECAFRLCPYPDCQARQVVAKATGITEGKIQVRIIITTVRISVDVKTQNLIIVTFESQIIDI